MTANGEQAVIFVGGVNRSGTTLLQSILCSDETTNPLLHEASYLRSIVEAYEFGRVKFDEHGQYYFDSVEDMRAFTADWARAFLERIRRRYPGAQTLVLKHPPLTPRFPSIAELLPEARFVIIVRDPRDVAASLIEVGEKLRAQGDPEGRTLERDAARLATYYMQCYRPAFANVDAGFRSRVAIVRYEDLVSDPEPVVEQLRAATGLALDRFRAEQDWQGNRIDIDGLRESGNAWVSELWGRGLSAQRIGRFRERLTAAEIADIERICEAAMRSFNYR